MLTDLYKGEEEDFLRLNYGEGFSMYSPIEWVSFLTVFSTFLLIEMH